MSFPSPPQPPHPQPPLRLALHSSSETLGVGLEPLSGTDPAARRLASFPLGRALSNELFACVESLLPAADWPRLARLAVATGPGGFTGTRLTVVLARTLAQQLQLPLDGPSSFLLIARRLGRQGALPAAGGFWLVQPLARHGLVAGLYGPGDPAAQADQPDQAGPAACGATGGGATGSGAALREWRAPRLYRGEEELRAAADLPQLAAEPRLPDDVAELLDFSREAAAAGAPAPWEPVLPLYPTSPVAAAP